MCGERTHPPRSQKGPPDGIVKYLCFKTTLWWQTLTFSMHFYQFEDFKFLIFVRGACPRIPDHLRVSNRPDFTCESQILTRRHSRAVASTRRTKEIASVKLLSLHVTYFFKIFVSFLHQKIILLETNIRYTVRRLLTTKPPCFHALYCHLAIFVESFCHF